MRISNTRWAAPALAGWVACTGLPEAAAAGDAPALLAQHRCYICHADRDTVTGPAFADVAAQLRTRQDAVAELAREIRAGLSRGGPWHMPPHPEISQADATIMARYIVDLANAPPTAPAPGAP